MKKVLRRMLGSLGLEVCRTKWLPPPSLPGSSDRPIADIRMFLKDIQARGFVPKGIVDVGAHSGQWTRMALSVFPAASVLMIEPQNEMVEKLEQVCADCGHDRNPLQTVLEFEDSTFDTV